jgi:FkbM family methyltransferase
MSILGAASRTLRRNLPDAAFARLVNLGSRVVPGTHRLRVERSDSRWRIDAGDAVLDILSPKRATLYRHGLKRRLACLLDGYAHPPRVVVEPGDVVLDIGSNIGEYALAAAAAGASRVLAFEPDPVAAACLRANAAASGAIEVHERLLWKCEEELSFTMAYESADSTVFTVDADKDRGRVTLRGVTLDAVLAEAGVERVDFLKLDAEGAEPEVLAGAAGTLARTRKVAVDAGAERMGEATGDEVESILRGHGFRTLAAGRMVFGWREGTLDGSGGR